jgi:hypothetical protein
MIKPVPALAIALALASAPVASQTQGPASDRAAAKQQQRVDRARERCKLNHGVDCDTPDGLREWVLQERSRQEAVRDGSHRRLPAQSGSAPSRP